MGVLEPEKAQEVRIDAALMKLLASDTRRSVLRKLKKRNMTLSELARALELKKATVLEHLRRLEAAELVRRREDERLWVYYELTPRAQSLVDPVGTRVMIVLGITVFALLAGAVLGAVMQPYLPGMDGATDAPIGATGPASDPGTFQVELSHDQVATTNAFTLHAALVDPAGTSGTTGFDGTDPGAPMQVYLLEAQQADRLRQGEKWTAAAQLMSEPTADGLLVSGPSGVPPGTYHVYLVAADGNDNKDHMPTLQVRPLVAQFSQTNWFKGLDDDLVVELEDTHTPMQETWLLVKGPTQQPPMVVSVENTTARISYEQLDQTPTGTYQMHWASAQTERLFTLPEEFFVHETAIHVLPPILLEGDQREIHVLLEKDTSVRPAQVPVQLNDESRTLSLLSAERGVVTSDIAPGQLQVQIGRHHQTTLDVLPDLRPQVELHDGPHWQILIRDRHNEPLPGVQVHLDEQALGTSDHQGRLTVTSQPPQGTGLLVLTTEQGHNANWSVQVEGWRIQERLQRLQLSDFDEDELELSVENLDPRPVSAILVGTLDEQVVTATPITLEGGADQRVKLPLLASQTHGHRWAVHAEGPPIAPLIFQDLTTPEEPQDPPAHPSPPASPPPAEDEDPDEEPPSTREGVFGNRLAESIETFPISPTDPVDAVDPIEEPWDPVDPEPTEPADEYAAAPYPEEEPTPVPTVMVLILVLALFVGLRRRTRT
jgi:DNA-binding transcriptional ArsR family regulator